MERLCACDGIGDGCGERLGGEYCRAPLGLALADREGPADRCCCSRNGGALGLRTGAGDGSGRRDALALALVLETARSRSPAGLTLPIELGPGGRVGRALMLRCSLDLEDW